MQFFENRNFSRKNWSFSGKNCKFEFLVANIKVLLAKDEVQVPIFEILVSKTKFWWQKLTMTPNDYVILKSKKARPRFELGISSLLVRRFNQLSHRALELFSSHMH